MQRATKSHQIVVHLEFSSSVDGMSIANHKAKKSNNPQNNSGLCQYVISVRKTSAVYIKIMIQQQTTIITGGAERPHSH